MTSPSPLCDSYSSIWTRARTMLKKFKDLTEKEILAVAIGAEEEDGRIYGDFADALREEYPATAEMFQDMRKEEAVHRDRLITMFRQRFGEHIPLKRCRNMVISRSRCTASSMFRQRFGEHIPLIRRENVKGFLQRRSV